jgi:GGDEF domain-containing protein
MLEPGLENSLLRRVLTDPATGLPNTLYLDLIRNWEEAVADRQGADILLLALKISGGTEALRRRLAWDLAESLRKSDFIASEGPQRFYLLLAVREAEDMATIQGRVEQIVAQLNTQASPETQIRFELHQVKSGK